MRRWKNTWVDNKVDDHGNEWTWQQSWTGYDAVAGIGCHNGGSVYSGGPGLPIFVTLVNARHDLEVWTMSAADATSQLAQPGMVHAWTNGKYTSIVRALITG